MNALSAIRQSRVPAFITMLSGAIFTLLLLPAYGQQEVDPTWYNPWPTPTTAAVHPAQPATAPHYVQSPATRQHQPVAKSASPTADAAGLRTKDTHIIQSHSIARKIGTREIAKGQSPDDSVIR